MMNTNRRGLRLCVCAALGLAGAPMRVVGAQTPKHTLFRATGPHGATVYLLGSVHLLSAEAGRLPPEVDSALAHAKVLALETNLDSAMTRAPELMARARYANGATLRSSLSPAGAAKLDTILRAYGLTVDQLDGFKPWFVSMAMSRLAMQRARRRHGDARHHRQQALARRRRAV
jgi:uncharacterized protein